MKKIPLDRKSKIQHAYVRYVALVAMHEAVGRAASIGNGCFWMGTLLSIVWGAHQLLGQFPYSLSIAVCATIFIIGAIIRSETLPKQKIAFEERRRIEKDMKEIDIIFISMGSQISTYYVESSAQMEFSPLNDNSYEKEVF